MMTITTKTASFAAFAAAIVACGGSTSDDDSTATKTMTNEWNGEPLTIHFDGVPSSAGPPRVEVVVDPAATRVTAVATFSAEAEPGDGHARLADVRKALGITEYPKGEGVNVTCKYSPEGGVHSENVGCTSLRVTIPPGSRQHPHGINVFTERGNVRVAESGPPPNVRSITCEALEGDAVVNVSPVPDGLSVDVAASADIEIGLPDGVFIGLVYFAENEPGTRIVTDDFPGMKSGHPWPHPPPAAPGQPSLRTLADQTNGSQNSVPRSRTVTVRKLRTGP